MKINLTAKQKVIITRTAVQAILYCVAIGGLFLILNSMIGDSQVTITLNWVKFLFGSIIVVATSKVFQWLFPVRRVTRKEVKDEYSVKK